MRRIEKVESLVGVLLKKVNGYTYRFEQEDIVETGTCEKNGIEYNYIETNKPVYIYYRNTENCTFYDASNYPMYSYLNLVKNIKKEEVVEEMVSVEGDCLNLLEKESEIVSDFYTKGFNKYYELENDKSMCFGFSYDDETIYIPVGSEGASEKCIKYNVSEVEDLITNKFSFTGKLCSLKRSNNKIDGVELTLKCYIPTVEEIEITKNTCDFVVNYKGNTGYVLDGKVFYGILYQNPNFSFSTINKVDISDIGSYEVLYKRYISTKKTTGITDSIKKDMFSYLNY